MDVTQNNRPENRAKKADQKDVKLQQNVEGVDVGLFSLWAKKNLPNLPDLKDVSLLSGGHSNLNILLDFTDKKFVLRRPPLGHVMESAHNMEREYGALSALSKTSVPAPKPVFLVAEKDDTSGIDAPFFVMDFIAATSLISKKDNEGRTAFELRSASYDLARTLATLHSLDPSEIGLIGFGKPEGYLERQLRRWSMQLDSSRSRPTPLLDKLIDSIPEPPASNKSSFVHGDFKMNNALIDFSGQNAKVAAVLDWEMATLGDPYADLAMFETYWMMTASDPAIHKGFESPVDLEDGYPHFDELLEEYEKCLGVILPEMSWYRAFAAMKISVITESLHYRYHIGASRGSGFELMADMTEPIAKIGLDALKI